jgi:hypothetical protein
MLVKLRCRFVDQAQAWLARHRAGQHEPLRFPAREVPELPISCRANPKVDQQSGGGGLSPTTRKAARHKG